MFLKSVIVLVASFFVASVYAGDSQKKVGGYSGSGEAGYSENSGNTVDQSLYAALKIKYVKGLLTGKAKIDANNKNESHITTQERYVGDFQLNRFFTNAKKTYGFGQVRLVNDRFEGVDLGSLYVVGLGHSYFDTPKRHLSLEVGVGYENINYTRASAKKDTKQGTVKLGASFKYQINPQVSFLQSLHEYAAEKVSKFESNTGVKVKLAQALNMKVSYQYRNNSAPVAGKKKVDTQTLLTLIYDF